MTTKMLTIHNASGLHARPASVFVKACAKYQAEITFVHKEKTYNAKSMINVMSASVRHGDTIKVQFDGPDEEQAAEAIEALVNDGMGE